MSTSWSTMDVEGRAGEGHPSVVEAVFFDFGGVFINSPFAAAATAAGGLGIPAAELLELVFGPYDDDGDHPWHRLERGELGFAAANDAIADLAEGAGHGRVQPIEVLMALATDRGVRDFMVELVRDLRGRGIATGIITNNIAEFGTAWRAMIPVDELFDDIVDSCEVGLRKPDPAIYRLACERLGVAPEASLFIDDHQGNVAGARAVGMHAVWCGLTPERTRTAADELLALIGPG